MKALLITAPKTNGGDFLIEKQMSAVLDMFHVPYEQRRAEEIMSVDDINSFDCVVAGGGPQLDDALLVGNSLGFTEFLGKIRIPVYIMGSGTYGACGDDEYVYRRKMSEQSVFILKEIIRGGWQYSM